MKYSLFSFIFVISAKVYLEKLSFREYAQPSSVYSEMEPTGWHNTVISSGFYPTELNQPKPDNLSTGVCTLKKYDEIFPINVPCRQIF